MFSNPHKSKQAVVNLIKKNYFFVNNVYNKSKQFARLPRYSTLERKNSESVGPLRIYIGDREGAPGMVGGFSYRGEQAGARDQWVDRLSPNIDQQLLYSQPLLESWVKPPLEVNQQADGPRVSHARPKRPPPVSMNHPRSLRVASPFHIPLTQTYAEKRTRKGQSSHNFLRIWVRRRGIRQGDRGCVLSILMYFGLRWSNSAKRHESPM